MTDFVCIGVPYFLGEHIAARTEVAALRAAGIVDEIGAAWVDLAPEWNAAPDPITAVNRALAQAIRDHRHRVPLIFASDCMSSIGAVAGLSAERDLSVIWYDAHGDFNTPDTSPSGFIGGMPLAMLVGRGNLRYVQGVGLDPLAEQNVILTDARDLDPAEGEAVRASAITHLPDVDALLAHSLPARSLYVHVDVDVVRLEDMPGMAYPATGGPALAQVAATLERIAREGRVVGVLFSLWNASLASDDRPLAGTLALVRAVVGGLKARE